ncbi:hypothetical protein [Methylomonas rosea]|uniref:Uncharacterized protein n=1 Tax=Methylomonas rosea TaxID=2952227 RepID=A0ABT1TX22_9GAMM|nr:hypothetical protein [Methylomonas sp. WSC-7]MCQ8119321.1 hypothetical protein [Methylomonas sp. WSC-7]
MISKPVIGVKCLLTRYLKEVSMYDKSDLKAQLAGALLYGLDYPRFTPELPDLASTALLLESIATAGETDLLPEARAICVNCPRLAYCNVGSLLKDSHSTTSLAGFSVPNLNPTQQKTSLFSSLGNKLLLTATALLAGLGFWRLWGHLAIGHRWTPVAFFSRKDVECAIR